MPAILECAYLSAVSNYMTSARSCYCRLSLKFKSKRTKSFFGLLWLLMAVCLSGCSGGSDASSGKLVGKYKPILNPHPKYFVTVKGRIDPSLIPQKHLLLTVRYYTANQQCSYVINQFEGVASSRTTTFRHQVQFNPNGDFSYKIALDRYLPGFCQWSPDEFFYQVSNLKGSNNGFPFGELCFKQGGRDVKGGAVSITMECSNKSCVETDGFPAIGSYWIKGNRSYHYTLIIKRKN